MVFPQVRLSVSDLLLITAGIAIAIPSANRFRSDVGSLAWLVITVLIICTCIKQIGKLLVGHDLPFATGNIRLRLRWITIRTFGALALVYFLTDPLALSDFNSEFSDWGLVWNFDSYRAKNAMYPEILTLEMFERVHSLIFFLGLIFAIMPMASIKNQDSAIAFRWFIAILLLPTLVFFFALGIYESQIYPGLVAIAIQGIDTGQNPRVFAPNYDLSDVPNFSENKMAFFEFATMTFYYALICFLAILGNLAFRRRIFQCLGFAIATVSLFAIVPRILQIYSQHLPDISYSWQHATELPTKTGIYAFAITTLFLSFLCACLASTTKNNRNKVSACSEKTPPVRTAYVLALADNDRNVA